MGNTGEHGHMAFVDTVKLTPGASHTFNRESGKDYLIQIYPYSKDQTNWGTILDGSVTSSSFDFGATTFGLPSGVTIMNDGNTPLSNDWFEVKATSSAITINPKVYDGNNYMGCYVTVHAFVADSDQPTPPPDPTTSFTTLSGDYSSAVTVQGTGSNKASNTEALQWLVDNTKGNLYKFTDHAGTAYWFTSANAVTMAGDSVTVTDCDYVTGNGTMVYSGGTLVFTAWQASPADQFTQLNGPYTVTANASYYFKVSDLTEGLNMLLARTSDHYYKVTDAVSGVTYYFNSDNAITDGQSATTRDTEYVRSDQTTRFYYSALVTLTPYNDPYAGYPPAWATEVSGIQVNGHTSGNLVYDLMYDSTDQALTDFRRIANEKGYTVFNYTDTVLNAENITKCVTASANPLSDTEQKALVLNNEVAVEGEGDIWCMLEDGIDGVSLYP